MSNTEQGLSSAEAARRLAEYGPNEPAPVRRLSAVVQLLHLFANPLVIILLVASAIAGSLGQQVDALIIVTMVVLGVAINFWQSYRSQQAAERLRVVGDARPRPCSATARWQETPLRNVVPGDVFRLSAGDLVPADARLLESRDLSVQQSMLTGESLPADKTASAAGERARRRPAPTRRTWCSSARRSSAARQRRSRSRPGRRRCSATSRCGSGAARRKPSSSAACADSAC